MLTTKEKIKNFISKNKIPITIAVVQWIVCIALRGDKLFFEYEYPTVYWIVVKEVFLLTLLVAWIWIFDVYKQIKQGNTFYKSAFKIFVLYFSILMLIMLLIWPGTWAWDDIWTLEKIRNYLSFDEWQNILTGMHLDVLLQILPFPGGYIIVRNLVIALCMAYTVAKFNHIYPHENSMKIREGGYLLELIPFILPPVLMYQFSGYRMGLYIYLELVVIVEMISLIKEERCVDYWRIIRISFLVIIVSTWRTESFVYVPFMCVLLLKQNSGKVSKKIKVVFFEIVLCGILFITNWQKCELFNDNYEVISILCPTAALVRVADKEDDAEELDTINKVVSLDVIYDNPDFNGEALFWDTNCVRNYNKEEYSAFKWACVRLALKYPKTGMEERISLLSQAICGDERIINNVELATALFDRNNLDQAAIVFQSRNWLFNKPINVEIRKRILLLFGGRKQDGTNMPFVHKIMWNAIFPMLCLGFAWIKLFIQKKWDLLLVCTAVVIRIPIVILTEPSGWFMYFLSFYFLGYVYLFFYLTMLVMRLRIKRI